VDRRADIWAFGAVLFEMLAGRRAFPGEDLTDTLAAVVKLDPAWEALPADLPVHVRQVVRACLQKDPKRRMGDMQSVRLALDGAFEMATPQTTPLAAAVPRSVVARALPWAIAGVAIVLAGGYAAGRATRVPEAGVTRFEITLPAGLELQNSNRGVMAIAPDGRAIVFVGQERSTRRLYIRTLDRPDIQAIPGTENATTPFFSPDSRWVGFFADGQLKKASLSSDTVITVTASQDDAGATWAPDGTIVFVPGYSSGLMRVNASGGESEPLTRRDMAASEAGHSWPEILPDGDHVLYTVEYTGKPFDEAAIAAVSLKTGKSKILLRGGTSGRYSPSGHILYTRGNRLLAAPFDARRIEVTGEATAVLDGVSTEVSRGRAAFAMSGTGTLAVAPGDYDQLPRDLLWATRDGVLTAASALKRGFFEGELSPDGGRVLFQISGSDDDLWLLDLVRDIPTRVTFGTENVRPAWAPNGKRFVWASDRQGAFNLFVSSIDDPSVIERLTTSPEVQTSGNWTPDGLQVVYTQEGGGTRGDIWAVDLDSGRKPRELVKTPFDERSPELSPDGRFLAYISDESGHAQVYVQAFPGTGPKRQVSDRKLGSNSSVDSANDGSLGEILRWSPDGRELFFLDGARLMSVSMRLAGGLDSGAPRVLFEAPDVLSFDVSPDGKRFLLIRDLKPEPLTRIVVALGAASEIGKAPAVGR
jgi:Tol biopolymer transport system component